jgi:hypothetical protein
MTSFGKSIRIYLKDGTVTGIKFGEVVNQTIQSIACPRLKLNELYNYTEANRPGVYFLFGLDENTGEPKAYIGEAENIYSRLQSHVINKDFWNEVIFFVSKDENLTKSHVRYLESRLIQLAITIKRYAIDNVNQSQLPMLPPADRDAMDEFLSYIRLLIGTLGHKILEEITSSAIVKNATPSQDTTSAANFNDLNASNSKYSLIVSGIKAEAIQTNEGLVVLKNSESALKTSNGLQYGYRDLREKLINDGVLKIDGERHIFQSDTLFSSPSQAAAVIVGYSINGPATWKDISGKSLKEVEKEKLTQHPLD